MFEWCTDDEGNVLTDNQDDAFVSEYTEFLQTLTNNITAYLGVSSLGKSFIEKVIKRLETFGYEFQSEGNDDWFIAFSINKVESYIKNTCNINSVPTGLTAIAVDRVCGEFLFTKKQTGQLSELPLNFDAAIKSVKTGDTDVTFAIGEGTTTDEQKLDTLISYLTTKGEGDLICYRRIKW